MSVRTPSRPVVVVASDIGICTSGQLLAIWHVASILNFACLSVKTWICLYSAPMSVDCLRMLAGVEAKLLLEPLRTQTNVAQFAEIRPSCSIHPTTHK